MGRHNNKYRPDTAKVDPGQGRRSEECRKCGVSFRVSEKYTGGYPICPDCRRGMDFRERLR